jgi:pimeloyl-ACP methyl ester carboxylesterase
MERFEVDVGLPVVVREWGSGDEPLLFWPGLNPFGALALNEAGPAWAEEYGFRVLSVSPPGIGETPALAAEDYGLSRLADLVVRLLDALELERVSYIGFSWGASIGCHLSARAPERLRALVLLDAGYDDIPDDGKSLEERMEEMSASQADFTFSDWDSFLEAARGRRPRWRPALEEQLRAGMREENGKIVATASPEAAGAAFHGVIVEPPSAQLAAVGRSGVPVMLVVSGERLREEGKPEQLERFEAAVPQGEVVHLPDSGHDVLADEPEETIRAVGEFLRRNAYAGGA